MNKSFRDELENNEVNLLRAENDKLHEIIACCYQLAGLVDAPLVWFDVLSDPKTQHESKLIKCFLLHITTLGYLSGFICI